MSPFLRGAAILSLFAATGCMPHFYTRQMVELESPTLEDYHIEYTPTDCLWKRLAPSEYAVRRDAYELRIRVHPALHGETPSLEMALSGAHDLALALNDRPLKPETGNADSQRYVVKVSDLEGRRLDLEIRAGEGVVGREPFKLEPRRCPVLSWRK